MKPVFLKMAYWWPCEKCGHHNYGRPTVADLSEEEKEAEFREVAELEPWESLPDNFDEIQPMEFPDVVICGKCETEFLTADDEDYDLFDQDPISALDEEEFEEYMDNLELFKELNEESETDEDD